jgi:hypothetical protein
MAAKLTRLTLKLLIQLHLVAESCTIYSSRSRRPVRKLLNTSSHFHIWSRIRTHDPSLRAIQDHTEFSLLLISSWMQFCYCRFEIFELRHNMTRTILNEMRWCGKWLAVESTSGSWSYSRAITTKILFHLAWECGCRIQRWWQKRPLLAVHTGESYLTHFVWSLFEMYVHVSGGAVYTCDFK